MRRIVQLTPVRAALLLLAMVLSAAATVLPVSTASAASGCQHQLAGATRTAHIGGIARPVHLGTRCSAATPGEESAYGGAPPLINHGGPIMSTPSVQSQVVVTPIFWAPSGYSFASSYKSVITKYLGDVAADSGRTTNVFASNTQYPGSNGTGSYHVVLHSAITDTNQYPTSGCTLNTGSVYADGSGYSKCLDDDQLTAEIGSVVTANGFTSDLGHIYPIFTPEGVESCFYAGNPSNQQCSINPSPSAAFCAYHSFFGDTSAPTVYANMPFPIYSSATGFSCTEEGFGGGIQSPNGDTDADVEVSPLSHEMSEAFTDPELNAWYDAQGNENGDDCAYIYGALSGSAGAFYNQSINGRHYLTQEEFSNDDYVPGVSGCIQEEEVPAPAVSSVSPDAGPASGGQSVTLTGSGFTGATSVTFGGTPGTSVDVTSDTSLTVDTPSAAPGRVDVRVTGPGGTSPVVAADQFTYAAAPVITSVTPSAGPLAGGQTVTIEGSHLDGTTQVSFGSSLGTGVTVVSDSELQVTTPAHAAGSVDVLAETAGGASAATSADSYRYAPVPVVSAVSPVAGPTTAGRVVTLTGTGLSGATAVTFGTAPGTSVTVVSDTRLRVTAPAHRGGTVDVRVTTPGGTSARATADRYRFAPVPKVTTLSPTSGTRAGGSTITVTGTGFTGATAVLFGVKPGTRVHVLSSTRLTVTTPAHKAGTVDVHVRTPGGTSKAVHADRYTFTRPRH